MQRMRENQPRYLSCLRLLLSCKKLCKVAALSQKEMVSVEKDSERLYDCVWIFAGKYRSMI